LLKEGHAGLSLILFSPFLFLFKTLGVEVSYILVTGFLMVGLSSIPDLDINFEMKHRGITHTLLFGTIVGIIFSILLGFSFGNLMGWIMGFIAGFGGTASHLLGDAMTYMPFKPLYPFSDKEISFGFFGASDRGVNKAMLTIGAIAIIIPFLF
jgi:inner membrane protein